MDFTLSFVLPVSVPPVSIFFTPFLYLSISLALSVFIARAFPSPVPPFLSLRSRLTYESVSDDWRRGRYP